jgi:transposase-like protein
VSGGAFCAVDYLTRHDREVDEQGRRLVVRNGVRKPRKILTGIGSVEIKMPRINDNRVDENGERQRFISTILPPYLRRTKSLDELLPWLYLEGISTGDMGEALQTLLGPQASGLSVTTIVRLKEQWQAEWQAWSKQSLKDKHYVYLWADGVYFNIRLVSPENARQCILVLMGATSGGKKELIAVTDGYRESEQSWMELLLDVKNRGLTVDLKLAIGDGTLGFCAALKKEAEKAFDLFLEMFQAKYSKATDYLNEDRDVLLAFYDFPAEHWVHIRTTNPIESTFATVRLRTNKTKGCESRMACLTMVFKLAQGAENHWRMLNGCSLLNEVIRGIKFVDGIKDIPA